MLKTVAIVVATATISGAIASATTAYCFGKFMGSQAISDRLADKVTAFLMCDFDNTRKHRDERRKTGYARYTKES